MVDDVWRRCTLKGTGDLIINGADGKGRRYGSQTLFTQLQGFFGDEMVLFTAEIAFQDFAIHSFTVDQSLR